MIEITHKNKNKVNSNAEGDEERESWYFIMVTKLSSLKP